MKDAVPWGSAIGLRINTLGSAQHCGDRRVVQDPARSTCAARRLLRSAHHRRTLGGLLLRLSRAHDGGPSGGHGDLRGRAIRRFRRRSWAVTTVATPHKIARAIDDNGKDVTDIVRNLDGKALDAFGRGQYQGITRDHYLEVDLGDDAPKSGPLYLIAQGSIHDTESSFNVAITQGNRWRAHGLSIEVPDGHGGWVTAQIESRLSRGPQENCSLQSHGCLPSGNAAQRAPAHKSRNLLGLHRVGAGRARRSAENTHAGSERRRPALSRLFRASAGRMPARPKCRITTRLSEHEAALARSDRLLHALWRCARAADAD